MQSASRMYWSARLVRQLVPGLAMVSLLGCGRIGFDAVARDDGGDAQADADAPTADSSPQPDSDLTPDASVTDIPEPTEPWSAPTPIAALNSGAHDDDPSLTGDGLELIFASDRPGGLGLSDFYLSRRASRSDPWPAPEHVPELSSASYDSSPGFSADGLTLWFASERDGNEDVYVTRRADRSAPWDTPTRVAELSSAAEDGAPETFAGDLMMVLQSERDGGDDDLFMASRDDDDSEWSAPQPLAEINTAADEGQPWMSERGTRLYFMAHRGDSVSLYIARRTSMSEPFGAEERIDALSTTSEFESDISLTDDERYTVFLRVIDGGDGDLYEASR